MHITYIWRILWAADGFCEVLHVSERKIVRAKRYTNKRKNFNEFF